MHSLDWTHPAAGLALCCLLVTLTAEVSPALGAASGKLDLNRASLEEILALPIPEGLARQIHDYRTYVRYFDNVYELMDVPGMTAEHLELLKPHVATLPPPQEDASITRLAASYRQVTRYLGQEGANEGLVDEYLDQLRDPVNVNDLDLFDLMSYQNVSPVDATNILKSRERLGSFENSRQLRRSQDLRYWAYRNLREFVVYSEEEKWAGRSNQLRGNYEVRITTAPYAGITDELTDARFQIDRNLPLDPAMTHKLRLDLTGGFKAGVMSNRWYGDSFMAANAWKNTVKGYVGVERKDFGAFHLKRFYLGNYRVAFGLGLIMDNTDFILFRKTGYGWNKRPIGVRPDLSRSQEFALTGGALEWRIGSFYGTLFASSGRKDGILNPDGTANQYVLMIPRFSENFLATETTQSGEPFGLKRNAFEEDLVGGNLKFMLGTGSFIGLTGYEARYDRGFRADVTTLVHDQDRLEARDSEIFAGYTSVFDDPETGARTEYKWRRVFGGEFQTVLNNVALQGEYAFLQDPRNSFFHKDNPDAWILNAYTQWNDLHLLAIYRDYDLAFDNPYNRAFSNDGRYEQTLIDSPFRLENDLYTFLSVWTPQPKPEKGIFLEARYRVSRHLTLTRFQFDQWTRKADGMDMQRYTINAEYQPIFNIRLRVRHRFSSRSEMLPTDVRKFRNWETRLRLITLLSNYNRLELGFMTSNVEFPPRPRLSGTPEPGLDSGVGLAAAPGHAFWGVYEHNLTPGLKFQLGMVMYDSFFWTFEGNEFFLLDGNSFRNYFKVTSRVSDRLLFQLKVTRDHNVPQTYIDVRRFNDPWGSEPDSYYATKDVILYRLQLDYTF